MKNKNYLEMLAERKLPFNLQYFAEAKDDDNGDDSSNDDSNEDDDNEDDEQEEEKKFTQSQLSAVASNEKRQGRKSAFKDLGFKSEKEAKSEIEEFRKWKESQLTPEQKKQKEIDDANSSKSDAEKRAQVAEEKLAVLIAGVRKDSIDDVLAIARVKVTEEKSLDDVLNEMKSEERYKSFFGSLDDLSNQGTGTNLSHKRGNGGKENIGARLGKQQTKATKKSSYFN